MNSHDSGRFCTESIESAAKRYKTLGFSVIPLLGARDSQHPKLPAIKWARFQHTHPSDEELQKWFHDQDDAGIGIVCGRVSQLMVLDFDDAAVASEFRHLHPDLANTFTVRSGTRGLPHLYFRLPENKLVTTSSYWGADLRGEGSYVVAPPTCVGTHKWIVEIDAPIHNISDVELRRVMRFLTSLKAPTQVATAAIDKVEPSVVSEFRHLPSESQLVSHYHQLCDSGRNQALFKTAVLARDSGILEPVCCALMAPIHARQPGKKFEDYPSRYAEAVRTINSAYKRAPRTLKNSAIGLGNAAREWLLGHELCCVARVLDGLYTVGMKPEDSFTELEACQKLSDLKIGRRSISAALKSMVSGKVVFESVNSPLNPPDTANAANGSEDLINSCEMIRGAKRVKNVKRGRPAQYYRLPSPHEVAELIGVKSTRTDVVSPENFETPKTYRTALHKGLLERRPGHYDREWVSSRLGVSRWTTRRYEKAANLIVQPSYFTRPISWSQANSLPKSFDRSAFGMFIESLDGKRYPAVRGLALKLLKQGNKLVLKQQQGNFYAAISKGVGIPTRQLDIQSRVEQSSQDAFATSTRLKQMLDVGIPTLEEWRLDTRAHSALGETAAGVGIPTPQTGKPQQMSQNDTSSSVGIPTPTVDDRQFWFCSNCLDFHVTVEQPMSCLKCGSENRWEVLSPSIWQDTQALKHWWQKRYKDHQQNKHEQLVSPVKPFQSDMTAEAKEWADKVYELIPNMSLANAQTIVRQFGTKLIEKALATVRSRKGLRSPAGFLISFLRSEYKLLNNIKSTDKHTPKPKGESARDWLQRLAQSQYLNFLSNAEDILNLNLDMLTDASSA